MTRSRRLRLEPLGDRIVPATQVFTQGTTLFVLGDAARNVVELVRDADGVRVRADGAPAQRFLGIDNVVVDTAAGNDRVEATIGPNRVAGFAQDFQLHSDLGSGDDFFVFREVKAVGDPQEQLRSIVIDVRGDVGADHFGSRVEHSFGDFLAVFDGGPGDDVVSSRGEVRPALPGGPNTPVVRFTQKVLGGDGNDRISGIGAALPTGTPGYAPPEVEMTTEVHGGAGDNRLTVVQKVRSPLTPVDRYGDVKNLVTAEGGNDSVWIDMSGPGLLNSADLDVQTGAGRDTIRAAVTDLDVSAFDADFLTGEENDEVHGRFQDLQGLRGAVRMDTGSGDDRFDVDVARVDTADWLIDLAAGAGNDRMKSDDCRVRAKIAGTRIDLGDGDDLGVLNLTYRPSVEDPGSLVANVAFLGGDGTDTMSLIVRVHPSVTAFPFPTYDFIFLLDGGNGGDRLNTIGQYFGNPQYHRGSIDLTVLGGLDDDKVLAFWPPQPPPHVEFTGIADGGAGTDDLLGAPSHFAVSNFEL